MHGLRVLLLSFALAAAGLLAVPAVAAHPVEFSCVNEPSTLLVGEYVAGFDATDPNTWENPVLEVFLISDPCNEPPIDYPGLCFGERPADCDDPRHQVWVPYCWLPECRYT